MSLRKREKGFTLIEVMLVVIIIGIIAIIALPKLLVTRETAAEKSCLSNLQALKTALEQYKWDNPNHIYPNIVIAPGTGDLTTLIAELMSATVAGSGDTTGYMTGKQFLPSSADISDQCPGQGVYNYVAASGLVTCDDVGVGTGEGHSPAP